MIFLDTFALVEITHQNPAYEIYFDAQWCTLDINAIEYCYSLLRDGAAEGEVQRNLKGVMECAGCADEDTILKAMQFRLAQKAKRFSYADALGYIYARRKGVSFLTGDRAFQHMDGVIFIPEAKR